ncbi:stage V sporulation protein AE [Bacillus sp. FJAT-49736]|uniref:stage V sporulation protein AE n=1 Tax=Bacillus sp. FJAT-49736 TaxID=2833582 RepID=UPI001BC99CA8|nr:stage V sporulation protein AE [Bacillus sp. FJAT-49736]MBS4173334.1 stage V sporulation protein AE [Bacillus sp. FJAT-49736]
MNTKRQVILITDGDEYAKQAIESIAKKIGGRCISQSGGNPSLLTGEEIVEMIKKARSDPVIVMFDDSGFIGEGKGEQSLQYVANHEDINVLGVVAVASNTHDREWTKVDVCIDRNGNLTPYGVDKFGEPEFELQRINGDTVYSLDQLNVPIIVGVGDIGKMGKIDHYLNGAPITMKAVELILERSGFYDGSRFDKGTNS